MKNEEDRCGMGKAGMVGTLQPSSKGSSAFRQELIIPAAVLNVSTYYFLRIPNYTLIYQIRFRTEILTTIPLE